jgi:hypothetical protein
MVISTTIMLAIISGIVGVITKSNILLILAGLIFLLGFIPIVSIPTPVWIVIVLLIVFVITGGKKK